MEIALFILTIAQAVFLTLKLSSVVMWSWWIVLVPFFIAVLMLAAFSALIIAAAKQDKALNH